MLASHRRFGQSDGASSQIQELLLDPSYQDFSCLQDFDLLLLSPDHLHTQSNTIEQSNLYNKQRLSFPPLQYNNQSLYLNQSNPQNQSYYQDNTIEFIYTTTDLPVPCEQYSYTDIGLLDPSHTTHPNPAQTQNAKLTNAERCKIFRERKKKKEKQLLEEKKLEEKKNTELNIRAKFLEDKVAKLKQIYFKRANSQKMVMPEDDIFLMFDH